MELEFYVRQDAQLYGSSARNIHKRNAAYYVLIKGTLRSIVKNRKLS